jgi:Coenzyme PQQ synthesis protein D (PqqD)
MMADLLVKADDLEVNEIPDGYVIYQSSQDRVHYLNKTAAIVFELCDGEHVTEEIVSCVAELLHRDASACDHEVRECVDQLSTEGLVLFRST